MYLLNHNVPIIINSFYSRKDTAYYRYLYIEIYNMLPHFDCLFLKCKNYYSHFQFSISDSVTLTSWQY